MAYRSDCNDVESRLAIGSASKKPLRNEGSSVSYGSISPPSSSRHSMPATVDSSDRNKNTSANGSAQNGSTATTTAISKRGDDQTASRRGGLKRHLEGVKALKLAYTLENKGSVARDHLANERTFLAWLRTSLSLASIGIAITQLFRLPSSTTITPPNPTTNVVLNTRSLSALIANSDETSIFAQELASMQQLLRSQSEQIALLQRQVNDPLKYRHLGKPIGGTFIALALVFLLLGSNRYFSVQSALTREPQSMFPPSRRTVLFASSGVGAIVVATFAAILAVR